LIFQIINQPPNQQAEEAAEVNLDYFDYHLTKMFDFVTHLLIFHIDTAKLPIAQYNIYAKFFYFKISSRIYHWRLSISIIAPVIAVFFAFLLLSSQQNPIFSFLLIKILCKTHFH
jgi:hypothetical protein